VAEIPQVARQHADVQRRVMQALVDGTLDAVQVVDRQRPTGRGRARHAHPQALDDELEGRMHQGLFRCTVQIPMKPADLFHQGQQRAAQPGDLPPIW